MANPFVKGWRYMMALFGAKIDEYADPKVQIQQAIEDAQRQHQALVQQAAAVIGNQRQLEMKLSRQMNEVLSAVFERVDVTHARQKSRVLLARTPRRDAAEPQQREQPKKPGRRLVGRRQLRHPACSRGKSPPLIGETAAA